MKKVIEITTNNGRHYIGTSSDKEYELHGKYWQVGSVQEVIGKKVPAKEIHASCSAAIDDFMTRIGDDSDEAYSAISYLFARFRQ